MRLNLRRKKQRLLNNGRNTGERDKEEILEVITTNQPAAIHIPNTGDGYGTQRRYRLVRGEGRVENNCFFGRNSLLRILLSLRDRRYTTG
jgi:hypothetical protein